MDDVAKSLTSNIEFVTDLCRYAEELATESQIRKKWRLSDATWNELSSDEQLIERIEAEKVRREHLGLTARERAQRTLSRVPTVLTSILDGNDVSPRHRIESARELRALASVGPDRADESGRVIIKIDLSAAPGGDKSDIIEISAEKRAPAIDAAPEHLLPAVAAKKSNTDDGSRGGGAW
jgi:hypothetical protein